MKILVVDDERASRKILERAIARLGHETSAAGDGVEALEFWKRERPRLIVTDWNMPRMDGPELCRQIRALETDEYTYVLLVTSREKTDDIVHGLAAGADDYLTKPFHEEELKARLKSGERVLGLQTKDIVIFALAKLAESRDTDTGNHLERIQHYCRALAEALNGGHNPLLIEPAFINALVLTSPLHDIGKVGIPDHILLKPGRLDDHEFQIMKKHTTIGFETLEEAARKSTKTGYLHMAAQIARSHHEKYDGSGYPDGLRGEAIPLAARIVAVADVYDALVSRRAYKNAFSYDVARSIIVGGFGGHFDPNFAGAFTRCEERFMEIHRALQPASAVPAESAETPRPADPAREEAEPPAANAG